MPYHQSWKSSSSASSVKNQLILAVGGRAYLHLPADGATAGDFKPFGQEKKSALTNELSDGQEVEIISWRPGGAGGVAYQIQRVSDRREWWAPATCLRASASVGNGAK